ncbi:hypothetical protein WUBG_00150 [Wuchereria bancrofti]|uniref:Uncharacterized protein n=1 Tax=Wuchereria bancrofti TaxID=6293 RepID=J9F340_WUCBA|nr:hypothetical protein WUBG_00150 [Wuchereria bancrofti]
MYDKLLILMNAIYCLRIFDKGSVRLENDNVEGLPGNVDNISFATVDVVDVKNACHNDDNNSIFNKLEGRRGGEKYFDENLGTTRTQHNHQDGEMCTAWKRASQKPVSTFPFYRFFSCHHKWGEETNHCSASFPPIFKQNWQ